MAFESSHLLDAVGRKLLVLLQQNARASYAELGRAVGLSAPAVAERMRRLEEAGVILGYRAEVDWTQLGMPITAIIRLSGVAAEAPQVAAHLAAAPEVLECHRVTGDDSYILLVAARSTAHLEALVDDLLPFGHITTALVLSSPVRRRAISPG